MLRQVVVVGASAAGLTTVEALRRGGYEGKVTLVGAEPHLPYDRPPLSKQVLAGDWAPERARLRAEDHLDGLDVELVLGNAATSLDPARARVGLADGAGLDYDGLVIATGVAARTLPSAEGLAGVHVLRTLDDALALRADLLTGPRVVVVGAGLIGCEVAATARKLGAEVTIVEPLEAPMVRVLGARIGGLISQVHADHGVPVRTGVGVASLAGSMGRVTAVLLEDGTKLPADVVVLGIGANPAVGWLQGSGLTISAAGVECDATCQAAPGVYAAGDVASWTHLGLGAQLRLEHRTNATEQGIAVAKNLLAGPDNAQPYQPLPYFWTDQYDLKIQGFGLPAAQDEVEVVEGDLDSRKFVALYRRAGRVTGAVGWNSARAMRPYRQQVIDGMTPAGA
ncbi:MULTISPECIES: FAD-dependent oxidoreductase [unclassified Crossiella]|uniref:NAD(P)/FAD-dependent oxidoreductase n=1 Tax=unclassified Crossiella TaxID=2620835 RepID=UPI002000146D|nr:MULTISPECIES: FAD-dependent oxidoreductase [unclassified Crossiella]MCK2237385.1 FAD-dependent oxidoreductase [Crossiella sp. S99.2]MCK2251040.1 FAD-dependent oxidoreductase [Crossiella sp. S99.1]